MAVGTQRTCLFLALCGCSMLAVHGATLPAQSGSHDGQNHLSAASTIAEQPIAAESSYGQSYGGKTRSYDSYNNDYGTPYITGSCYGQYPGMTGNVDYDCKTYSVCQADGRLDILYCPPYTRFNNYLGVCDWHFKVDSYCQPLYKEEPYQQTYKSSYGSSSSYDSYSAPKPSYGYEKSSYVAPVYSNYEQQQAYPESSYYGGASKAYDTPTYGHRSVYPASKKY